MFFLEENSIGALKVMSYIHIGRHDKLILWSILKEEFHSAYIDVLYKNTKLKHTNQ